MTKTPMSESVTKLGPSKMIGHFEHDSDEWHLQRGKVIGASEIAGVAGIAGAYHGPYMTWMVKNGLYTPPEPDEDLKRRFRAGHLAEHTLDGMLVDEFPEEEPFETGSWVHETIPWAGANPDRLVWDHKTQEIRGREYKNSARGFEGDWPPLKFIAQCEYTRGLLGLPEYRLSVLEAGWDVRTWTIKPGPMRKTLVVSHRLGESKMFDGVSFPELMRAGQAFVLMTSPPPKDGRDETFDFMKGRYEGIVDHGQDVQLPMDLIQRLHKYDRMQKEGVEGYNLARSEALELMKDAKGAYYGKTRVAYRQAQKSGGAALYLARTGDVKDLVAQHKTKHDDTSN